MQHHINIKNNNKKNRLHVLQISVLQDTPMPAADELNLYSLSFDDFSLTDEEMILASVSMFIELGLVKKFNIELEVIKVFMT